MEVLLNSGGQIAGYWRLPSAVAEGSQLVAWGHWGGSSECQECGESGECGIKV